MDRTRPIAHLRTQLRSKPLFEVKGHQIPFVHAGLVGAVGIETTHAWHFNDLRSRARTEKEGLGSPWNPYCRRNAAFFPMMLRTTLRFASRTALGIACVQMFIVVRISACLIK